MKNNITNNKFTIINFNAAYEAPKYNFSKKDNLITWGKDNNYPKYLTDLYNYEGSSLHGAIIRKKIDLTIGQGFDIITDKNLETFVTKNNLVDELEKISSDLEIFNGYAIEIIWSNDGSIISSMKHIPISQLRFAINGGFWYCADWKQTQKYKPEFIASFNENYRSGKQIVYYSKYNPSQILVKYPIASYTSGINSIETDFQISQFHLNQAKQGYAPSFILNFATGIPTIEEQKLFYNDFVDNYSGTENAGKCILTYSENNDGKPEFTKIDLNDSDKRFLMLNQRISDDIITASDIPIPILKPSTGNLSSDDRMQLLKEFQMSYISPRQNIIENTLNNILKNNNYSEKLILKKYTI